MCSEVDSPLRSSHITSQAAGLRNWGEIGADWANFINLLAAKKLVLATTGAFSVRFWNKWSAIVDWAILHIMMEAFCRRNLATVLALLLLLLVMKMPPHTRRHSSSQ